MSQVVETEQEDKQFVGREEEQQEYQEFLCGKSGDPWLLIITGLGGIGKSSLLLKLREQTPSDTFVPRLNFDTSINTNPSLQADNLHDDQDPLLRTDPLRFLEAFAYLLKPHCDLQKFEDFTDTLLHGRAQLAELEEQVRQKLQAFSDESVQKAQPSSQVMQSISFAQQQVNRQVRELVTEACYTQIDTFQRKRLVVMLDTCELLNEPDSWMFSQWLMNEFLPRLHNRMLRKACFVVMASRIPPESEVIHARDQQYIALSLLKKQAVDEYLKKLGMSDLALRQSVYKITMGHALCVAIIGKFYQEPEQESLGEIDTSTLQAEFDEHASVELIRKRILNRLTNPFKDLTRYGVLLRSFNLPLLQVIFPELLPELDARLIFNQFIRYPYIEARGNYRYAFHELIREVLAKNTHKDNPDEWTRYHKRALDYFSSAGPSSRSMDWYYHNLAYHEIRGETHGILDWQEAIQEARDRGLTKRVGSLLQLVYDEALNLTTLSRAVRAYEQGRFDDDNARSEKAFKSFEEALKLFEAVTDHPQEAKLGKAKVLLAIGDVQRSSTILDKALTYYMQALDLFREMGDRLEQARVLQAVGDVQRLLKDWNAALEIYQQALLTFREMGDRLGETKVLQAIGDVQSIHGETETALAYYEQVLDIFRQVGNRPKEEEARVWRAMGDVQQQRGEKDAALKSYGQALVLFRGNATEEYSVQQAIQEAQLPTKKPTTQSLTPQTLSPVSDQQSYTSPPFVAPRRRQVLLAGLTVLVLLIILGSGFIYFAPKPLTSSLSASPNINSSTTAAIESVLTAQIQATAQGNDQATAQTMATATGIANANPNPYPPHNGRLVLFDPLKDNSMTLGWLEGTNELGATCKFIGGTYQATEPNSGYFHTCMAQATNYSNFVYEVRVTLVSGDYVGIVFRSANSSYYIFIIDKTGQYTLKLFDPSHSTGIVLSQGFTSPISLKQSYILAVGAEFGNIDLYMNQQNIASVKAHTPTYGRIGVLVGNFNSPSAVALFSNAKVWVLG